MIRWEFVESFPNDLKWELHIADGHVAFIHGYVKDATIWLRFYKESFFYTDEISKVIYATEAWAVRRYCVKKVIWNDVPTSMDKILNGCGFYAKEKCYQKLIEPWRFQMMNSVFDEKGYIICQGKLKDFPFGKYNTADTGCGWIAAYNLLRMNLHFLSMQQCAEELGSHGIFRKRFGQEEFLLYNWLVKQGMQVRLSLPGMKAVKEAMASSRSGILLYTHKQGMHYTAYRKVSSNSFQFYNAVYGLEDHIETIDSFFRKYSFLPIASVIYIK